MEIIYYGIDTKLNTDSLKNNIKSKVDFFIRLFDDIDDKSKIIIFAGRLVRHKGIYELLEAFNIIQKNNSTLKLVILGSGENKKVQLLIKKYGLEKNVYAYYKFLSLDDVMRHFYFADLCIFPSFYEPFGMVAIEAMSLGKPIILGNGFSDFFFCTDSEPYACKVNSESPDDIATKILELIDNKQQLKKLSDNGKKFVENFDQEKLIGDTLDLYKAITKNYMTGGNKKIEI